MLADLGDRRAAFALLVRVHRRSSLPAAGVVVGYPKCARAYYASKRQTRPASRISDAGRVRLVVPWIRLSERRLDQLDQVALGARAGD